MKKKAIVIDDVDNPDSMMGDYDDDDDDDGCTRFMVNAISEHRSAISGRIDVPIICLDEDDNDDLIVDKDYKVFLGHLRDGYSLSPHNGESDTRRFKIFSCDSKLQNDNSTKNRVYPQGMKKKSVGFKGERVNIRESIQRDNRAAERRKRRTAELVAARTSRSVPSLKTQLDNTVSEGRKRQADELKAETLRKDEPLVSAEEGIQRDNNIAERRERKNAETKAAETSRVVHVERVNRVTEVKDADAASRSKQVFVERRKKNEKESAPFVDKDYMRYLTWLVDSLRDSTTKPMANHLKDQSDLDTLNEPTIVPEKDLLPKVKIEQDLESLSDGSDIIVIGDTPFLDGEGTPFVASKSKQVVDLDEESKVNDSSSSWFRKELEGVLKKPYDERELKKYHRDASIHRKITRCRELRKGRETNYDTNKLGQSYREQFPDFENKYKLVDGVDKERALELLRGLFFYLTNVSHEGAFKPWEKNQWCRS